MISVVSVQPGLMPKPSIFVGSSKEGLEIGRAIGVQLDDDAEVTVWSEGAFAPGLGTIESLMSALDRFRFAALVLTPDDLLKTRGVQSFSPRDNVMFELGLFMGRLGRSRTFIVCSNSDNFKIPSDLAGFTILRFNANRSDGNLLAALGPACFFIRQALRDVGSTDARLGAPLDIAGTQAQIEGAAQAASGASSLGSTQAKILEILADTPSSFDQIRRQLYARFDSETRPAVVREKLEDLVAKGMVWPGPVTSGDAYEIAPPGLGLMRGSRAT